MLKTVDTISYLYDADGNRYAKWNNGVPVKSYFYSANGEVLAEVPSSCKTAPPNDHEELTPP